MDIQPRIEFLIEKKMVGLHKTMSLVNNRTFELWNEFGPKIKTILDRTSSDRISLQVYDASYFQAYDPKKEFVKWALVEVNDFGKMPQDLSKFIIEKGMYAVFDFKNSLDVPAFFQYIYGVWLPNSSYELDERAHFEVLGETYKKDDPLSEEEIWIPIKEKDLDMG